MIGGRSALLSAAGGGNPYGNWTGNYDDVSLLLRGNSEIQLFLGDESTPAKTLALVGDVGISTETFKYGGNSLAFDGNGDWITGPNLDLSSTAYTIEFWVYLNTIDVPRGLLSVAASSGDCIVISVGADGKISQSFGGGSTMTHPTALSVNTWNHVALTRNEATHRLFVNGDPFVAVNGQSNRVSFVVVGNTWRGSYSTPLNGFMDDVRITTVERHTTNFTPPSELPADSSDPYYSNVLLLLRGAVPKTVPLDESPSPKVLTTAGNAAISTSIKKYGTSSMVFDGSGDYFQTESNSALALGSGDFTVEAWVNPANITAGYRGIIGGNVYISAESFVFYQNGSAIEIWRGPIPATRIINATSALTAGTFQHVAWTRQSGVNRCFVNGVQVGSSVSDSTNYTATVLSVGSQIGTSFDFNGYIDDLRITKGVARYTKNFLPPPAELPAI